MPSLMSRMTQLLVAHTIGSSVVDDIGLAETPAALEQALERGRKGDTHTPPRDVAARWSHTTVDVGAPLHVLAQDNRSVLLYVHGGAYVVGPNAQQWRVAAGLAQDAGLDLAVLDYALAPTGGVDDGIQAVVGSLDALAQDYDSVSVFADSAGAGLALAALQVQVRAQGPLPRHTVLFSPWVDASLGAPGLDDSVDALLTIEGLRGCARLFGGDVPLDDPRLSPLAGPMDGLPPIEVHAGTRDLMAVDAQRLHDALTQAGVTSALTVHADMPHDFVLFPSRESRDVLADLAESLRDPAVE